MPLGQSVPLGGSFSSLVQIGPILGPTSWGGCEGSGRSRATEASAWCQHTMAAQQAQTAAVTIRHELVAPLAQTLQRQFLPVKFELLSKPHQALRDRARHLLTSSSITRPPPHALQPCGLPATPCTHQLLCRGCAFRQECSSLRVCPGSFPHLLRVSAQNPPPQRGLLWALHLRQPPLSLPSSSRAARFVHRHIPST